MVYMYENIYVGHVVTRLVDAMRYKPKGREFDSR
jgi:hypothetical protein